MGRAEIRCELIAGSGWKLLLGKAELLARKVGRSLFLLPKVLPT